MEKGKFCSDFGKILDRLGNRNGLCVMEELKGKVRNMVWSFRCKGKLKSGTILYIKVMNISSTSIYARILG